MNLKLAPGRLLAAAIVALSVWIVHGFVEALLAACVTAIASWPLYCAFRARLPRGVGKSAGAAIFTGAITVFVLAPMAFACWALLSEAHALLLGLAAADSQGLAVPEWLVNAPALGPWLAERWQPRRAPRLGAVARTVHGPQCADRRVRDPATGVPLSGGSVAEPRADPRAA
jgi:predicted PurR-regulated permease PerM